jgi:hypothetical protein
MNFSTRNDFILSERFSELTLRAVVPGVNRAHWSGVNGLAPGTVYKEGALGEPDSAVRSDLTVRYHGGVCYIQAHRAGQDWLREEEVRLAVVSDIAACWCHCCDWFWQLLAIFLLFVHRVCTCIADFKGFGSVAGFWRFVQRSMTVIPIWPVC